MAAWVLARKSRRRKKIEFRVSILESWKAQPLHSKVCVQLMQMQWLHWSQQKCISFLAAASVFVNFCLYYLSRWIFIFLVLLFPGMHNDLTKSPNYIHWLFKPLFCWKNPYFHCKYLAPGRPPAGQWSKYLLAPFSSITHSTTTPLPFFLNVIWAMPQSQSKPKVHHFQFDLIVTITTTTCWLYESDHDGNSARDIGEDFLLLAEKDLGLFSAAAF